MVKQAASSRRRFIRQLAAGAGGLVVGFDPAGRSWVSSASAQSGAIDIPQLDGTLSFDPATLARFADDFGHLVHHTPLAVLKPGSVQDVVRAVRFCRQHQIEVAARGQGHSTFGQSQVQRGLVIDISTLANIEHFGDGSVTVQAGLRWNDLLAASVPLGLMPRVLTGYTGLSVGGTLSMGGIGAASFRHGAQVDNVLELEVVTGKGELQACSARKHAQLFDAVLGGVGQYGVIVRATLPTLRTPPRARNFVISYTHAPSFFADLDLLASRSGMDGMYGQIVPNPLGGWIYMINAVKFFSPASPPHDTQLLERLNFPPAALQVTDFDTLPFLTLVDSLIDFLGSIGLLSIPHVWGDVFVPSTHIASFVQDSLAGVTAADLGPAGFVLVFPIRNRRSGHAFRLPTEREAYLFDILTSGSPADPNYAATQIAKARAMFERARAAGGTLYPIGSTPMSKADWIDQYGQLYPALKAAKARYDPAGIMTPGAGIF